MKKLYLLPLLCVTPLSITRKPHPHIDPTLLLSVQILSQPSTCHNSMCLHRCTYSCARVCPHVRGSMCVLMQMNRTRTFLCEVCVFLPVSRWVFSRVSGFHSSTNNMQNRSILQHLIPITWLHTLRWVPGRCFMTTIAPYELPQWH